MPIFIAEMASGFRLRDFLLFFFRRFVFLRVNGAFYKFFRRKNLSF